MELASAGWDVGPSTDSQKKEEARFEGLGANPTDRGRAGSKIHLHVDKLGAPAGVVLSGANVHDSRLVSATIETIAVQRPVPTAQQPQNMAMDKGYDYRRVRHEVEQHGYTAHIRGRAEDNEAKQADDFKLTRWVVERTHAWLKGFRAIRTRYCCRAQNYLGFVKIACAAILTRLLACA